MVISWDDPKWFDVVITINEIKVEHRGENMTGPIKSGYMRVNGMIKATNWDFVQKKNGIGGRVWMDQIDVDWAKVAMFTLPVVAQGHSAAVGLLLARIGDVNAHTYKRIGLFEFQFDEDMGRSVMMQRKSRGRWRDVAKSDFTLL